MTTSDNNTPDPADVGGGYALHIGITADELGPAARALADATGRHGAALRALTVDTGGDDWRVWGESICHSWSTMHAVIAVPGAAVAEAALDVLAHAAARRGRKMRRMGVSAYSDVIAVLTDLNNYGALDGDEGAVREWELWPDGECTTCGRDDVVTAPGLEPRCHRHVPGR